FTCDDGYEMLGPADRICFNTGEWSVAKTTCRARCQKLTPLVNGRQFPLECFMDMPSDKDLTGVACTHTCNVGYGLIGEPKRVCRDDGTWSESPPVCRRICTYLACDPMCPILTAPPDSTLQCTGHVENDTCALHCAAPYRVRRSSFVICQNDGSWSEAIGECIITCPKLTAPARGGISPTECTLSENFYEVTCTYSCEISYVFSGFPKAITRTCGSDGIWTGGPVTCVQYQQMETSISSTGTNVIKATPLTCTRCSFLCVPGYEVTKADESSTECDYGIWSGDSIPSCSKSCHDHHYENIGYSCSVAMLSSNTLGSMCSFSCPNGQVLIGEPNRVCFDDGDWSAPLPVCGWECPPYQPPTQSTADVTSSCKDISTSHKPGDVCKIACNDGYVPDSSPYLLCRHDGTWNNTKLACIRSCHPPPSLVHGTVMCNNTGLTYPTGTLCTYTCDGVRILEPSTSWHTQCLDSGVWSTTLPACQNPCPSISNLLHGDVIPSLCLGPAAIPNGQVCRVTCHPGYTLSSHVSLSCLSTGQWSDPIPTCEPDVHFIMKSVSPLDCHSSAPINASCTTICESGFELMSGQSSATIHCQVNGEWSSTDTVCKKLKCIALPSPSNGVISNPVCTSANTSAWSSTECKYSCNPDSTPDSDFVSLTLLCLGAGKWSETEPRCVQYCPALSLPASGVVSSQQCLQDKGSKHGDTCTFTCLPYFELSGTSVLSCQSGSWSASTPTCQDRGNVQPCPPLDPPNFSWLSVDCTMQPVAFGTECQTNCVFGLRSDPTVPQKTYCHGAAWTNPLPQCKKECPRLPTIRNGYVEAGCQIVANVVVGKECSYFCDSGYKMVGTASRICEQHGVWSVTTIPSCVAQCSPLGCTALSLTSFMFVSPVPCSEIEQTAGKICTLSCSSGYILKGPSVKSCLSSGEWSGDASACKRSFCQPLPEPTNGRLICPNLIHKAGDVCELKCDVNYVVDGQDTSRKCLNTAQCRTCTGEGKWTGRKPYCVKPCPIHEPPKGGTVLPPECSETTSMKDMVCAFSCHSGLVQTGSHHRVCFGNGSWSGVRPNCQSTCPPIEYTPENGILKPARCGNVKSVVSQTCTLLCEPGYKVSGNAAATCLDNGLWSSLGTCVRGCSAFYLPYMGAVLPSKCVSGGLNVGDICRFECFPEHTIDGSSLRTCRADGTWTGSPAHCIKTCTAINADKSVTYSPSLCGIIRQKPGTNCTAKCASNMKSSSGATEDTVQCLADGAWDKEPVTNCFPGCPPRSIKHGKLVCDEDIPGRIHYEIDVCGVWCNYSNLTSNVECLATGFWEPKISESCRPVCSRYKLTQPHAGFRDPLCALDKVPEHTVCEVVCSPGYLLKGEVKSTTCESDSWTPLGAYACLKTCPSLGFVKNGKVEPSECLIESCTVQCNPGYRVQGPATRHCSESGHWSSVEFSCVSPAACHSEFIVAGTRECTTGLVNDGLLCQMHCTDEKLLHGAGEISCMAGGIWSAPLPKCDATCPALHHPRLGRVFPDSCELDNLPLETECNTTCDAGYTLTGDATRWCLPDGTWSGGNVTCEQTRCSHLNRLYHGTVAPEICTLTEPGVIPGTTCYFTCDEGYQLKGVVSVQCQDHGQWPDDIQVECQNVR
uniref:Sushi domain-containing protein n=1 Tax=Ciona savignyi TaxID=51511 RepID=H2Z144_CIOSA